MSAPAPLTPADCDLRDYKFLPLEIARLFGSEFHAHANDAEWRAGVTLWLKSYHQVPAASMPDNDVDLARAAEFGGQVKAWKKVRTKALHSWVKCSDGRLYHPVVAEKALEGWIEKLKARKSSGAGNAKRYKHPFDPAPFDAAIAEAVRMLEIINPASKILKARTPDRSENGSHQEDESLPPGDKTPPAGRQKQPIGSEEQPIGTPAGIPPGSQVKGREEKERKEAEAVSAAGREADERAFREICKLLGYNANDPRNWADFIGLLTTHGVSRETAIKAADQLKKAGRTGSGMGYLRPKAIELQERSAVEQTAPVIFSDTDDEGWVDRWRTWRRVKIWPPEWGPQIGEEGCRIPAQIQQQIKAKSGARA